MEHLFCYSLRLECGGFEMCARAAGYVPGRGGFFIEKAPCFLKADYLALGLVVTGTVGIMILVSLVFMSGSTPL